jgi:RimJ/RimL family protein N-acetyltransferase
MQAHNGPIRLATERLILRPYEATDWPAVLAYQSDPLYLRYYHWTERTEQDVRAFVQRFIDQQHDRPRLRYAFAVTLRPDGRLIGNCNIRMSGIDACEGEIGYEFAPEYWGRGYATEAARAVVAFGFDELRLHRVASYCVADNAGSARVMEKLGMTCEGRLRENEFYKGRYWDTLLYGILEEAWRARQPAK